MNKEYVAYQVGVFIEKYHNDTEKVELPVWKFKIKRVFSAKVSEESLEEVGPRRWTFKATAKIEKTDDRKTVSMVEDVTLAGNAIVTTYIAKGTNEQLPQVEFVTITHIAALN